ncbi:MAG: LysM peptidoglycan-binding domain-containing protein [Deltaproteobacteria bacterium]|nr:LysM peptidoglycan-binding domain-containing protein [Deltaproteobacteria bacterium]
MKRWIPLVLLCAAAQAMGQEEEEPQETQPAVDRHVVEAGDTLWHISQRFLGSPWLWPKVWAYNPEITNPHWIYPGDIVRFFPSDQELPSLNELIADRRDIPEEEPAEEVEPVPVVEEGPQPLVDVVEAAPIRAERARGVRRFVGMFVTPKELAESGTLTNSVNDKMLLAPRDSVYVSFPAGKKPQPGERFMVYRTLGEVVHPVSGARWGYMTQITALASIEGVGGGLPRARLDYTVVEVERGQYVTPFVQDPMLDISPTRAGKPVEGVVLAVRFEGGAVAGEQQVVFIDKGKTDGLDRGNELDVIVRGDPLTGRKADMPPTSIGRLMVLQANENASTCLVLKSTREIEAGTKVVTVQ